MVYFSTAYDIHTFVAELPAGHSEDIQIICYDEVNIKLCFEHEVL